VILIGEGDTFPQCALGNLRSMILMKLAIVINSKKKDSPGFPPDNTGLSSGSTPYS